MSHKEHLEAAPKELSFFVITISSSRYAKVVNREPVEDESGDVMKEIILKSNHKVSGYAIVPDDKWKILKAVVSSLERDDVDVIVTTGGTGYTPNDVTVETIRPILDREVTGFGEVFRFLSLNDPEVRGAAFLTKATAGVVKDKAIFVLPGSPAAVRLAMEKLVIPESPHLVTS